jgi:tRNA-Thr(GGU) m(6)t(6)A37 methyltransferase TsaA
MGDVPGDTGAAPGAPSAPDAAYRFAPIGMIRTCFTEKFGLPRQSLMVSEARGVLKLNPDPGYRVALNHLERFSHLWVVFVFHRALDQGWRPTIRPPRVDAPRRVGVFASRSPHRPNPVGMSVVRLERIDLEAPGGIELHLSGIDLMDGTPVLDIKPYLPYADRVEGASGGWAEGEIPRYAVEFAPEALETLRAAPSGAHPRLTDLVTQMLEWDPRPTSQRRAMPIEDPAQEGRCFGFRVLEFDVRWEIRAGGIRVLEIVPADPSRAEQGVDNTSGFD